MRAILPIIFIINGLIIQAQTGLNNQLSMTFGGLPINKSINKIIGFVEKNGNYNGNTHYNLALSYSGFVKKSFFFQLKPDTSFIEIVSEMMDITTDSIYFGKSSISLDACYRTIDSLIVLKEYYRIVDSFSQYFKEDSSMILKGDYHWIGFYRNKKDVLPLISVSFRNENCYTGNYCIMINYIRKEN